MKLQVIDINYVETDSGPILQIFGRSEDGSSKKVKVTGFRPYFYAGIEEGKIELVKKIFKARGYEFEEVERFEPIGYQTKKKKMLKIYTKNPKDVRALREKVRDSQNVKAIYEADVIFKNRFMVDVGITGMGWIEVEDKKEIDYREIDVVTT